MADSSKDKVSTTSSPEEKVKAAVEGKPVEVDHGEKSDVQKDMDKAAEEVKNDPWGDTPAQMRDDHPNDDIAGRTVAVDGISPEGQELPEDQGVTGGTLPPV